jgi:hypothetical protein
MMSVAHSAIATGEQRRGHYRDREHERGADAAERDPYREEVRALGQDHVPQYALDPGDRRLHEEREQHGGDEHPERPGQHEEEPKPHQRPRAAPPGARRLDQRRSLAPLEPPAELVEAGREDRADEQEARDRARQQVPEARGDREDREPAERDQHAMEEARGARAREVAPAEREPPERRAERHAAHRHRGQPARGVGIRPHLAVHP